MTHAEHTARAMEAKDPHVFIKTDRWKGFGETSVLWTDENQKELECNLVRAVIILGNENHGISAYERSKTIGEHDLRICVRRDGTWLADAETIRIQGTHQGGIID